jgi:hypothetical protein
VDPAVASRAAQEARELVKAGHRLDAIRHYRQLTGAGFTEAIAAIGLQDTPVPLLTLT